MKILDIGKNLQAIVKECQKKELLGTSYDATKGKILLKDLLDPEARNEEKIEFLSCLMHWITKDYDLSIMPTVALQEGKIYLENDGDSLKYTVIDPKGKAQTGKITKQALGFSETEELSSIFFSPAELLPRILKITEKAGHTIAKTLEPSKEESTFKKIIGYSCAKEILLDLQKKGEYLVPDMFFTNDDICKDLNKYFQDFLNFKHLLSRPLLLKGIIAEWHQDKKTDNHYSKINLLDDDAIQKFCSSADEYEKKKLQEKDMCLINSNENKTIKREEIEGKNKPSIAIKVHNSRDGVGDFKMFRKMAGKIKSMVGEAYDVIGILEIDKGGVDSIRNTITADLEDANPFDLLYIFDNNSDEKKITFTGNKDNIKVDWSSNNIKENDSTHVFNLKKSAGDKINETTEVYVNLVYMGVTGDAQTLSENMRPGTIVLICAELGQSPKGNERQDPQLRADTGLPYADESYIHGLLIETYPKLVENDRLSTEKQFNNQKYINKLLGGSSVGEYAQSHIFKMGYLQSAATGTAYILSNVLTHMNNENVLEKKLDFHLNNAAIDKDEINAILKKLGIEDKNIEFISPDELKKIDINEQTTNDKKVRIFCGCRLETNDYKLMCSLCSLCNEGNGIAGVSGDNTFTECVSSGCIPFAAGSKEDNQFFRDFLSNQFKDFLKYNNFNALSSYFEKNIALLKHKDIASPDLFNLCKEIATDLKSPQLKTEWRACCRLIKEKYNYYDKLPSIIENSLRSALSQRELIKDMAEILHSSSNNKAKEMVNNKLSKKSV